MKKITLILFVSFLMAINSLAIIKAPGTTSCSTNCPNGPPISVSDCHACSADAGFMVTCYNKNLEVTKREYCGLA